MEFIPVESSNIEGVNYEPAAQTLHIQFKGKDKLSVYRYEGVPMGLYTELLHTESKGKFFQSEIRGKFNAEKVEG